MSRSDIGGKNSWRVGPDGPRPDRAVIDIGSNTVRMVVYAGSHRAPDVWLNEKVTARLGRDLSTTGALPSRAMETALGGLARFAMILADLGVGDVQTVATAAVRNASNGANFLHQVEVLGLTPRLLSGEEEARISAMGVIGAFPRARGIVADLGGGSLELVAIDRGTCCEGVSLPLGTLRLAALRASGDAAFRKKVKGELACAAEAGIRVRWRARGRATNDASSDTATAAPTATGCLFMVGGTWRAMAAFAMHKMNYPLSDPHGFVLSGAEADRMAKKLSRMAPDALAAIDGISSSRAAGLPDAAALLRVVLAELQPESLTFSSWGLREGLLVERLEPSLLGQDPLIAGITAFTAPRGASPAIATHIAAWTADATHIDRDANQAGTERLRLAAIMLALAAARIEPNMRLRHATDWALDKRWLALDHHGRAMIASALRASCGKPEPLPELLPLASEEALREASAWGLAIRLCRRIGAGSRISLLTSSLTRTATGTDDRLELWLDNDRASLANDTVRADLANLAAWLGLSYSVRLSEPEALESA